MNIYNPKEILEKTQNIAVIGFSTDAHAYANNIVRKLRQHNKVVYPVNPYIDFLFNEEIYESLEKCPKVPDLVVFVVNPLIGIDYLSHVKALGIPHIWLQPGTFDIDFLEEAKRLQLEPIEACVLVVSNYL